MTIAMEAAASLLLRRVEDAAGGPGEVPRWGRWLRRRLGRPDAAMSVVPVIDRAALLGRAVAPGERVTLAVDGRETAFDILDIRPAGAVTIDGATEIRIAAGGRSATVSYDDIGGLGGQMARVREMIELPLRHPELFARLGIDPPKGVLLYGPPGCGKTLIARAVAHESGCHFVSVNGPEIIQQGYGESEAHLRRIFKDAEDYPATIIFLDEVDALAPNRDVVVGDVEKRVVAQLLGLMDGLRGRGQIIVIAATNLPNNIDPALRRPGRFDREISIGPPDRGGRLEILRIHTRGMPLDPDVDLDRVAGITHGFLGADLAALCREAAMLCARDFVRDLGAGDRESLRQRLPGVTVAMRHFEFARNEIELSTTRQVTTEVGEVGWDDVGGLDEIKRVLREVIEWPLKYDRRFAYANTTPPKGILLTGPPGTGKTLLAKAMAAQCGVNFISVKGPELLSKWIGESERGIREIFKKARQASPCLVFFDEIDTVVPMRGKGDGGGNVNERMVGQFLLEMDSMEELRGVVVLAATNRPDLIDPALLRPGRFDLVIDLPLPDQAERGAILAVHCRGRQLAPEVSLAELAAATEGFSGAELQSLCQRAAMFAIRQSIEREPGREFAPFAIEQRHFAEALALLARRG